MAINLSLYTAQISIVLCQKCGKIFVGDPHQQIYSFRLAVNAMESVKASTTLYLTQVYSIDVTVKFSRGQTNIFIAVNISL